MGLDDDRYTGRTSIWSVVTFEKEINGVNRKVQVILTMRSPVEAVLCFHSSVVMNVITPFRSFCLYPFETLQLFQSVAFDRGSKESDRLKRALAKYSDRGWEILHEPSVNSMLSTSGGFMPVRALGDRWCFGVAGPLIDSAETCGYLKVLTAHGFGHRETTDGSGIQITTRSAPSQYQICLPADSRFRPINGIRSTLRLEEELHAAVEYQARVRLQLLQCLSTEFLRSTFYHQCPTRGLSALHLASFLYPLYTYFRTLPHMKAVFTPKTKTLVRLCILLPGKVDYQAPDAISWNQPSRFISHHGFEVYFAKNSRDFEKYRHTARASTVKYLPNTHLNLGLPMRSDRKKWRPYIEQKIEEAVNLNHAHSDSSVSSTVTKNVVVDFVLNAVAELKLDDVKLHVARNSTGRGPLVTLTVQVPDEWLPRETSPVSFMLNRLMQAKISQCGFAVEFRNASGLWM
ncbi:hypothetical protein V5O48_007542 [Marasmius crinis-equi]|uniref:Uncharacterized protein n=1 Tax=Marasmius crinis-equi TaxID=585013 RepID=A0ABR3FGI6_9AGAR